ncbi:CHAT domain-containing protein [Planktothrix mougeotii]|uniref:CHAT domain-containing protein n=1 Tax=Planktothrix mougeotii LEGE 06226 TaxID=1828728 RepID=A0ABR9UK89_9CYAN|nr:CHAT domain-containing tetratricopeptide repeat protein [Planktothrix mougeotii]MBE9146882.1 CHAT domain-containing protein [Planktothrix mougeotii LEGE 06226]
MKKRLGAYLNLIQQWSLKLIKKLITFLSFSPPSPDDEQFNQYSPQDYRTLIQGLFQTEYERNIEQLNTLLADNRHLLNLQFAEVLKIVATGIIEEHPEATETIVALVGNISIRISDFPLGNPRYIQKIAIAGYEFVLGYRQEEPELGAQTNNNLGNAYSDLAAIENTQENLKAAIACYQQALIVRQQQTYPQDWAGTNNNLGNAYSDLAAIENTQENLKAAIACYQQALIVRQQQTLPQQWATTNNNLGNAYSDLAAIENTQENLKAAIACYQQALIVRQQQTYPQDWAGTNNNLGTAYSNLAAIENTEENLKAAIACYRLALIVRQQQTYPQQWATTNNNLGNAYSDLAAIENTQENLKAAIACYRQALIVRQPKTLPLDCVQTGRNLGNLGFKIGNWEWGIEGYEAAMKAVENSRSRAQTDQQRQEILAAAIGVYANAIQCYINLGNYQQALLTAERSRCRQLADLFASKDLYPNAEVPPELVADYNLLKQRMNQLQTPPPNTPENPSKTRQLSPETLAEIEQLERERKQLWQKIRSHDPVLAGQIEVDVIQFAEIQQLIQDDVTAIVSFYSTNDQTFVFVLRRSDLTPLTPLPCEGMGEQSYSPRLAGEGSGERSSVSGSDLTPLTPLPCEGMGEQSYSPRLAGEGSGERSYSLTLHTCDGQGYKTLQNWILQNWLTPYVENKTQWHENMGNFLTEIAQRLQINQLIEEHLQGIEELIIIPHLYLHQIPFAALPLTLNTTIPTGETQTAKTRQMAWNENNDSSTVVSDNNIESPEYLCDRFRLRVVPSCQILKYCSDRKSVDKPHQLGIVENATGDLFYTEIECQTLAKRYQVSQEYHLKEQDCTQSNYIELAKKVQRLHSSHHANADLQNPENCKLVLANKEELNLATIFTLRFPTLLDLFLSCCETHLTLTPITDEPLSLAAGFLSAGARNVVSTLWAVNDQTTAILTILYYQYLDQGKTRPEALRLAQFDLRNCKNLEELAKSSERLGQKVESPKNSSEVKYPYSSPYYWAGFLSQGLA